MSFRALKLESIYSSYLYEAPRPLIMLHLAYNITSHLYTYALEVMNYLLGKVMLGSHCLVQIVKRFDGFGERFFNELSFVVTTKWKLLLLLFTILYGVFRLLQKTCKCFKPGFQKRQSYVGWLIYKMIHKWSQSESWVLLYYQYYCLQKFFDKLSVSGKK